MWQSNHTKERYKSKSESLKEDQHQSHFSTDHKLFQSPGLNTKKFMQCPWPCPPELGRGNLDCSSIKNIIPFTNNIKSGKKNAKWQTRHREEQIDRQRERFADTDIDREFDGHVDMSWAENSTLKVSIELHCGSKQSTF